MRSVLTGHGSCRRRLYSLVTSLSSPGADARGHQYISTAPKTWDVLHPISMFRGPCPTRCMDQVVRNLSSFSAAAERDAGDKISHGYSGENVRGVSAAKLGLPSVSLPSVFSLTAMRDGIQHYGKCYWELSKARLSMLVVMTSAAGFVMGSGAAVDFSCLGWTCAGTMMAASSANSFNQILEVSNDAAMKRTMRRPLPSGRLSVEHALAWAVTNGVVGVSVLAYEGNSIVAALGAANILLYTLAYTPLKQLHPVNTWVGAVVGAVPPLMGWAAATGQLDPGAWVLAAALYFWQLPHFMALAYLCSKDYSTGGYKMVSGQKAALVALRNCFYLLPIGFVAHYAGISSSFVGAEAFILTVGMGVSAALFYQNPSLQRARHLFRASLLYLPLLMLSMLLHRIPNAALEHEDDLLDAPISGPVAEMTLKDPVADMTITDAALKDSGDKTVKRLHSAEFIRPPIAFVSAAPFPFLPVPEFR